jgi:hypothetical protein
MDRYFVIIRSDEGGLKSSVVHHNKSMPKQLDSFTMKN